MDGTSIFSPYRLTTCWSHDHTRLEHEPHVNSKGLLTCLVGRGRSYPLSGRSSARSDATKTVGTRSRSTFNYDSPNWTCSSRKTPTLHQRRRKCIERLCRDAFAFSYPEFWWMGCVRDARRRPP